MKYFFLFSFFIALHLSLNAQNNSRPFIDVGYQPEYLFNSNDILDFGQSQLINGMSIMLGIQNEKLYFFGGIRYHTRNVSIDCVTYPAPDSIFFNPVNNIAYNRPDLGCSHVYNKKIDFIDPILGIGHYFKKMYKTNIYAELIYAPLIKINSKIALTSISSLNEDEIFISSKNRVLSWSNLAINCGLQRPITHKINFKLGLSLKSNDIKFNKLLIGGDLRLQYAFN